MRILPLSLALLLLLPAPAAAQVMTPTVSPQRSTTVAADDDARTILARYTAAWRGPEEMALPDSGVVLGFDVRGDGGGRFHVMLSAAGAAVLHDGLPPGAYHVIYETDIDFLRRLDRGELNALTAMGQARGDDPTPLVPRFPPGFRWTAEARAFTMPLVFHFWNRESPEVIRFGAGTTRQVHGANMALLYYASGLRTAWAQLLPGMRVNDDAADQANPFPSLMIMTRGVATARIGGREMVLQEGEAVLIPAGVTHTFWATAEQYGECIVIMFGPGA
jgi:mannose-6-phosphate isomerase-like protein (cupin superfamily)